MEPAAQRLRGVARMLAFRPGWRACFDVSPEGFWRSFTAALYAAPFFVLAVAGQNAVSRAISPLESAARTVELAHGFILYACLWAYFPLVARIFVRMFRAESSFAPWVVVHNWALLLLLMMQAVLGGLLLLGVLTPAAYMGLSELYFIFAIYTHCRVALGALDLSWPAALGGACAALLAWLVLQLLLVSVFAGAAVQA